MNASNLEEVGQILSKKGTSMKMRINPEIRHSTLNMMRKTAKEKMFAIPRAMQRMMHSTPVLSKIKSASFQTRTVTTCNKVASLGICNSML